MSKTVEGLVLAALAVFIGVVDVEAQEAPLLAPDGAPGPFAGLSSADSEGIRQAHAVALREIRVVENGHEARHFGQTWRTHFDGRGFSTQPNGGGWSWGLQLEGYGFAGAERVAEGCAVASVAGVRMAYDWDEALQEWYVNRADGLEHGFTLRERPPHGLGGPLTFTLAVRGGLEPRIHADGRGAGFADASGRVLLRYDGLVAFDADGRDVPARLDSSEGRLLLTVDEEGARYPLTIDPLVQQAYLKASNPQANDLFGVAVAISSNTVVIGASSEDSNATGVNGNQANEDASNAGAAYVFVRDGTGWTQQAYLKASNTEAGDAFGGSVAITGDTIVVGADREKSNATGVNGDQANNSLTGAGAAYVFVRSGSTWTQQAYLKASNTGAEDQFGTSVAISGDTVVVGAPEEDSAADGINGDQSSNAAVGAGAVYVFVRNGSTWTQQAYIKASNSGVVYNFGEDLGIHADTVVVGSPGETSNATGVNGNQASAGFTSAGAAYVFVRSGTTWSQQAYVKASNTGVADLFGLAVDISGNTVVVGAPQEDSSSTGVNGNQTIDTVMNSGAAYVFVRSGTTWTQQAYLKASNSETFDSFGRNVAIAGEIVAVGSPFEDSAATGVNGNQADNSSGEAGAVYVFTRSGTTWSQQYYVKAFNPGVSDNFGWAGLAVSGNSIVASSHAEDSSSAGVNADPSDNSASGAGAVYVFDPQPAPWTNLGLALAGVTGKPSLVGSGTLVGGSPGSLALTNAKPSAICTLHVSIASTPVAFKGGTLVAFPTILDVPLVTSGSGTLNLPFVWPTGLPPYTNLWFQYSISDLAAVKKVALSNALKATTP